MDISAAQHQLHRHYLHHQRQEMSDSQSLDSIIASSKAQIQTEITANQQDQKKPRPPENEPQKCPRCDSTNTKFCYYNNYSLTQPRYFCKSCRRYWTKGGTLRNVPVGGGCRKSNKRSSSVTSSPTPSHSSFLIKRPHNHDAMVTSSNPNAIFSFPSSYNGLGFDIHALGMGNANVTDCDGMLGHGGGLFQSLCYGNSAVSGEMNLGGNNFLPTFEETTASNGTTATTTAVTVTTMKQEDGRALWGFPWQVMNNYGESVGVGGDLENVRGSNWNGLIGNSTWHGLLNTPALMQ